MMLFLVIIFVFIAYRMVQNVNRKYLKVVLTAGISFIILWGTFFVWQYIVKEPIGEIRGAEYDCIIIDGIKYEESYAPNYSFGDRGRYLGKVETDDSKVCFRVYAVKGSDDYIYRLWDWEGAFYKRVN
jgi:hypothetical protein